MNNSIQRKINVLAPLLLNWSEDNYREFPWRNEFDNVYKILCIEILLQKTSAEKVLSIYKNFFNKFSTPQDLSKANLDDVIEIIKPTGLYNKKSQTLIDSVNWMIENGINQDNIEELKNEVKGVSDYVINAISIFCFGQKKTLIDVNVRIIFKLIFNTDIDKEIIHLLLKCTKNLNENELKRFYLALIDLGSAYRSEIVNPLDEDVVIVTVDKNSYNRLIKENFYWRFKHSSFRKNFKYMVFYQKRPAKSLSLFGKVKSISEGEIVKYHLSPLFELNPPIILEKGEYPPVSFKYSRLFRVLNAESYSDI